MVVSQRRQMVNGTFIRRYQTSVAPEMNTTVLPPDAVLEGSDVLSSNPNAETSTGRLVKFGFFGIVSVSMLAWLALLSWIVIVLLGG